MSEYKRPYARGVYGTIGDRWSEGHDAICVVGDMLIDIDEFYTVVKERDGYPCLKLDRKEIRPGGAGAVHAMVQSLGVRCLLATDHAHPSTKRRVIVDGRVVCRIDEDEQGEPIKSVPPAEVYLIADYGKGAIDERVIDLCHRFPKHPYNNIGREVIADWHPSRPPGFYRMATLKSSWGPADIETQGADGLKFAGEWFRRLANVIDPCGAGDMVLATLGVCRLKGLDWREACRMAAENAARVCERWGAA